MGFQPGIRHQCLQLGRYAIKNRLWLSHAVHLVDHDNNPHDAEEPQQHGVAASLFTDAFGRIHNQDGGTGFSSAGYHMAQKTFMAGRIDNSELPHTGFQENARGINGHTLIALGLHGVHQEGGLEFDTTPLATGDNLLEAAIGERIGVRQQAADQRGFAMINMAGKDNRSKRFCHIHGLEIPVRPQAFECVFRLVVHAAPRPLGDLRTFEFQYDVINGLRCGSDRRGDVLISKGTVALSVPGKIKFNHRQLLAARIEPYITLGPVEQRVNAHMAAFRQTG